MSDRERWLNGWPRNGLYVVKGNGLFCAGCGQPRGAFTAVFAGDEAYPERDPDWPFEEATCPVHGQYDGTLPMPAPKDPRRLPT